ncbi:hypothetical protein GCM10023196_088690 [Actinoallomurus vinaceus]|uniref:Uncharacterized protein n=1 Tax=Actinoallomurus vinaceus TaxID=1080074 RepID=A0ABP8USB2_9ACTN
MTARTSIQDLSGPRRGLGRRTRGPLAAMAFVATLLAGCNSGAVNGSGGDHGGSGGSGGHGGGNGNGGGSGGDRYGFGLPDGPSSGNPPAFVYNFIRSKQCDKAQKEMEYQGLDKDGSSYGKIMKIGIAVCRHDLDTAQDGLRTLTRPSFDSHNWFLCELYRASASVVYQRPRSAYGTCPAPEPEPSAPSSPGGGESSGPATSTGPSDSPESSSGTGG